MPPHAPPRLVQLDRTRRARFQALYAIEALALRVWRGYGRAKLIAGLLAWLWGR
jgi:hypothetical protein